ncbi:MAG: hypothetical protein M5U01_03925 [Ardenticatenaceae bacterium]|nr:hypothetical protein [Ardenticatenaceae bacterium]HBY97437.1 hypothetical protein [Chloroflexota bacterium]
MQPHTARCNSSRKLPHQLFAFGLLLLLGMAGLTGCQPGAGAAAQPLSSSDEARPARQGVAVTAVPTREKPAAGYSAKLEFTPPRAEVGSTVEVHGTDYPAGAEVELVYYTVKGRYELEGGTEFVGQRYDERSQVLATVRADQSGAISSELEVPLDYGGSHDVRGRVNGEEISQASLTIQPTFSLTPSEGPVGTPIELRIAGVDWQSNINTWHVLYDNRYFGFMSAVTTQGVAVARFRAAGPVGTHAISVWHNSFNSIPYLNWQQGPYKDVPGGEFTFRVTEDAGPPPPLVEDFSATDSPWDSSVRGPGALTLELDRGTVGQQTTLRGRNLPANANLSVQWWTMVGNRVSASGFSEESRELGSAQTGPDGTFAQELTIPDDLGGQHRIEVIMGDKSLASTGLVIEPSVASFGPTRVHAGEEIKLHLKGVGWTTYDNTYTVTYDNAYIGYVCGFSTNGDVQFSITASGAPGTHIIDLYPTIYKGQDPRPRVYSVPQLTYATDHPQRITPAIRLAVEIVGE